MDLHVILVLISWLLRDLQQMRDAIYFMVKMWKTSEHLLLRGIDKAVKCVWSCV